MSDLRDPAARTATGERVAAAVTGHAAPAPATLLEDSWRDYIFAEK